MTTYQALIKQWRQYRITSLSLAGAGRQQADRWWMTGAILFYMAIGYYALHNHIIWQSVNVMLGMIALPVVTVIQRGSKGHSRYPWIAILLAVFCTWLPVKTFFYTALAVSFFFTIESFLGKTNSLPLLVIGMMSPMFQYLADIFSFPIRLQLTEAAGKALLYIGNEVQVKGNTIYHQGNEFAVDPACMGLNMLVTSMLLQVLLVAVFQKKFGRTGSWWQVCLLLGLITGLNIIANLLRIVCLVQFNILPGTMLHEIMGMVCLVVYVVLPAVFLTRWVISKYGKLPIDQPARAAGSNRKKLLVWHLLLALMLVVAARAVVNRDQAITAATAPLPSISGYEAQRIGNDVIKLQNARSLVYLKSIEGFYSADHNPSICWRGSGYTFRQIEKAEVNNQWLYIAELHSGKDRLFTAWWYDNGATRTIDQFIWRKDALINRSTYALINVTADSRQQLEQEIQWIQKENKFKDIITGK